MRGMASAKEGRECPPNGRYPLNITAAAAGQTNIKNEGKPNASGGEACIKLDLEIAEGQYAGYPLFDTLGTDGQTNFGGMSKKRLRALEVQGLDSDAEIPDEVIAASLLGRRVWAEVEREPQQKLNTSTNKWEDVHDVNEQTGIKVPRYRLKIVGYLKQAVAQPGVQGGQLAPGPQGGQLPPGYPQQGVGQAPQGYPQQGAPQFAPPQQQGGQLPPGFPTGPGAPGGFPGGAPTGYAMPPGGFPQVQAPAGWVNPQAPNGAPQAPQFAPQQGAPGQQPFPGFPGAPR